MREAREKLESEMEDAYHEHQANLLRQGKSPRNYICTQLARLMYSLTYEGSPTMTCVGVLCHFRSAEATGGTEAHGRDAQPGDAKEKGNAAQVIMFS